MKDGGYVLRPVDTTPKPDDELREDQHGIVHHCTFEPRIDIRLGSMRYWWAVYLCGTHLVTRTVQKPVNCFTCLKEQHSAREILEAIHARQGS